MICFLFSIFDVLETTFWTISGTNWLLWFAFFLVSLTYWKQLRNSNRLRYEVVICFLFSIFDVLETTMEDDRNHRFLLWFAFFLVSLTYWKQPFCWEDIRYYVVICFLFSIFDVLETTEFLGQSSDWWLWFAFFLLSLTYWKQLGQSVHHIHCRCDLLSF